MAKAVSETWLLASWSWRGATDDHPLTRYAYTDADAEDPLECPSCGRLYDVRFWGKAAVSFMLRNETYRHDSGLMCPECKTFAEVDDLMRWQEEG